MLVADINQCSDSNFDKRITHTSYLQSQCFLSSTASRLGHLCGILVSMGDSVAAVAVVPAASHAEGSDECCSPQPPSRGSTGSPSPVGVKRAAEENEKQERKRRHELRVGLFWLRERVWQMERKICAMEALLGSDSESS